MTSVSALSSPDSNLRDLARNCEEDTAYLLFVIAVLLFPHLLPFTPYVSLSFLEFLVEVPGIPPGGVYGSHYFNRHSFAGVLLLVATGTF